MKKILIILSIFFLFTLNSKTKEHYIGVNVSDLLKKGFRIIKQEETQEGTKIFLTNNRDFVVCRLIGRVTSCREN